MSSHTTDCPAPIGSVQQPLKIHGGKSYLADWIIGQMTPHVHYVEPFAGGLAVLLRKPCEGVSEVVNDQDGELINFWRVLQGPSMFEQLRRRLEATPFAREEFDQAESKPFNLNDSPDGKVFNLNNSAGDQVERACRFFIRCRQSRQGLRKDFATLSRTRTRRGMNEQASAWWTAVEGLPWVYERLRRVVILHDDACRVIRQQDGPDTLVYADPPYVHATRVTTDDYAHEMTTEQHVELLETLAGIRGRFLLSGYPNALYGDFAGRHGWRTVTRAIDCKASSKTTKETRVEALWRNY